MRTVAINASRKYDVVIGQGLLQNLGKMISEVTSGRTAIIVSDDNVFPLYGSTVKEQLLSAGFEITEFVFLSGENSKNLDTYGKLLNTMSEKHLTRNDVVVALGGGVVGDLAGFAAATYQRGTGFVQVPTSLLAAVDSSVGGKTAVDLPSGKNQVGAFYQPSLVLCDTDTLKTLPDVEYRNGCAEIIKYAMIEDEALFEKIKATPVKDQYEEIIEICVKIKQLYVESDEFDVGKRMFLNFGHTIGHCVEACSNYEIPHGQGVAIGMVAIAKAAWEKGFCSSELCEKLNELIEYYSLPTKLPFTAEEMFGASLSDKKNFGKKMRLIVPESIGKCRIETIGQDDFMTWLKSGGAQ